VKSTGGKIHAIHQPHRFSRLNDLFEDFCTCFNNADTVLVADVYTAGEAPIEGFDRDALVEGLRRHGHRHAEALPADVPLADVVAEHVRPGDLVICMGAGSITGWAQSLPEELAARLPEPGLREVGA
jgi:UDP-N-acetylmuramate--alanine ligase